MGSRHDGDEPAERWEDRPLKDGPAWPVFKRVFDPEALAAELARRGAARRTLVRRRARGVKQYRSLASLKRDQRTCRACIAAGYPLESLPVERPARDSAPTCSGRRPESSRAKSAGRGAAGRQDPPPLARVGRGGVLRDVLLRIGDSVLSGTRALGTRRPDAGAGGAAPLRTMARRGAPPPAAAADRHRRRPRCAAAARRDECHRIRRRALRPARCGRDPPPPPVRRVELAERAGEPRARRGAVRVSKTRSIPSSDARRTA